MMTTLNLGIPRRADGLLRPWALTDEQYLSASPELVAAHLEYEAELNRLCAKYSDAALAADYQRLREPKVFTWGEWQLSRGAAYFDYERWVFSDHSRIFSA